MSSSLISDSVRTEARLDETLFVAVGLSWGAGVIHVAASSWHAAEYVPFAVAFALLAAVQLAWGAAVYVRATPRLLAGGVALSLGVVAVWLVSRTAGLPVGPEGPEPWGVADVLASADEALLCVLVVASLWGRQVAGLRRAVRVTAIAAGVALVSLSSLTFMLGGHS